MTATRTGGDAQTSPPHGRVARTEHEYVIELRLPDDAVTDHTEAFFEPGSLELHVPRRALAPHTVRIARKPSLVHPDATPC